MLNECVLSSQIAIVKAACVASAVEEIPNERGIVVTLIAIEFFGVQGAGGKVGTLEVSHRKSLSLTIVANLLGLQ